MTKLQASLHKAKNRPLTQDFVLINAPTRPSNHIEGAGNRWNAD